MLLRTFFSGIFFILLAQAVPSPGAPSSASEPQDLMDSTAAYCGTREAGVKMFLVRSDNGNFPTLQLVVTYAQTDTVLSVEEKAGSSWLTHGQTVQAKSGTGASRTVYGQPGEWRGTMRLPDGTECYSRALFLG